MKLMRIIALAAVAVIAALSLAACDGDSVAGPAAVAVAKERALAADNQNQYQARCEQTTLTSQETENLCARAKVINAQNFSGCITLLEPGVGVVAFYHVKGKVSSLNSYLLPGDKVWKDWNSDGYAAVTVEAPDIDGAYGKNADGIFFFTSDTDSYVEWQGDYFFSNQCLAPSTPVLLKAEVNVGK